MYYDDDEEKNVNMMEIYFDTDDDEFPRFEKKYYTMINNIYDFLKQKKISFIHLTTVENRTNYDNTFLLNDKFLFKKSIDDYNIIKKLDDICSNFQTLYPNKLSVVFVFSKYTYDDYMQGKTF